ncbi:hypothetical protein HPB50_000366 [Hyalomma asiaticum]|uniref:Uncharacterized protein n=1 Tax=Hyalomma asiaticum TaxID=266040 RepID=A0ACB7SNM8_HYAAI|nr:hypothetical protein HPB50_000366 [Hyalomma asiaticum]
MGWLLNAVAEVDMTIMPLIQTYSRYAVGEYSPVIIYVPFGILSASDVSTSNVFGYILTFDWKVWAVLLCAIPILALLISLSEFVLHRRSWRNIPHEVHQRGWELFGNLLYESSPRPTSQTSGRIVLTSWLLAVLVIANSFAGHLKSSMAVKNEPAQVDSVQDVVNRPSLKPIIWKGTYYEALISTSGRIVLTSWLLAVLVIANSFAGHLKSSMAVKNEPAQVDSVQDVVNRPSLKPIIWKGTYYEALISGSPSPLLKRLWRMVQRNNGSLPGRVIYSDANMREVIERRAVFMVDHNSQRYHLAAFCRRGSASSFHFGREIIEENKLSFLMSRSMPRDLHRRIYTRVTWLYESGLVSKWLADELGDWQRCVRRTGEHMAKDLSIDDTLATFVLWGMVMGAAAVALIVETLRRPREGRSSPEILF